MRPPFMYILGFLCYAAFGQVNVQPDTKDLGLIKKGDIVSTEFKIVNSGGSDVKILSVIVPCGCLVEQDEKIVMAGQTGTLRVKLDSRDLEGPITKGIYITTDNPRYKFIRLFVIGVVKPRIDISPSTLIDVDTLAGHLREVEVVASSEEPGFAPSLKTIEDLVDGDFGRKRYTKVQIDTADRSATATTTAVGSAKVYNIKFIVSPDAPEGNVDERVTLETGLQEPTSIVFNLVGMVKPAFSVLPDHITWGPIQGGPQSAISKNVVIINNVVGETVLVTKAECVLLPQFSVAVSTVHDGQVFDIVLTGKGVKSGVYDGAIKVYIDGRAAPIEIPVHVQVL